MIESRSSVLVEASSRFDWRPTTRVIFGEGSILRVGEIARDVGGQTCLVVTDPGIEQAGHAERAVESLTSAGLKPIIFDGVAENPTTEHVEAGVDFARRHRIDLLVGLGGGSAMDTAKGINFILAGGGTMADYRGVGKGRGSFLPMIAVPTTAGTGSEAQSFALIADARSHEKMACGDKRAAPVAAILDPQVTLSQPAGVTAACGIDALSHAIESFVTRSRNPISNIFASNAWKLLSSAFPRVLEDPNDPAARGDVLLGAHFAGCAIENSMLGATHSLANPLTARFGVVHGQAIGLMLPHVIRFNGETVSHLYAELLQGAIDPGNLHESPAETIARQVEDLVARAKLPSSLRDVGVDLADLPKMAREASEQWTARHNPRPISAPELERLYRQAYN